MFFGFFDDVELHVDQEDPDPDIFAFGGYLLRLENLTQFESRIHEIKEKNGVAPWAPIKWNLKDVSLRNFFCEKNHLEQVDYDHLIEKNCVLRKELLTLLSEFSAVVFISGRYDKNEIQVTRQQYYEWAFENLLQRIGLAVKKHNNESKDCPEVEIVVDWPQENKKWIFDIYHRGYFFGRGMNWQEYYAGKLGELNFFESPTHGSTLHSGALQLADLCVGCCRDFLIWAYKGKGLQKIQGNFDILIDLFDVDKNGQINGYGYKVARDGRINIDEKISEYKLLLAKTVVDSSPPF